MEKFKERFFEIWEWDDDYYYATFDLVNEARKYLKLPVFDIKTFDEGWQYRTLRHTDKDIAWDEFANVVLGWW